MTRDIEKGEMLALNTTTGLVHDYTGTVPGGHASEEIGGLGIAPCGCEGSGETAFEGAAVEDNLIMIRGREFERGIWEAAECLGGEDHG